MICPALFATWARGSDADGVSAIRVDVLFESSQTTLTHSLTHYSHQGRVELFALLLARHNINPAIVVRGGDASPYMISPTAAVPRAPGFGTFTCCSRNHVMVDEHGVETTIPCKFVVTRMCENLGITRPFTHFLPQVTKIRLAESCFRCWRRRGRVTSEAVTW